jgi:transposase-like protein
MAKQLRDAAKEAYWREVLGRHASSGLSVREFCERERLTESQFYAWRRTIGERSESGSANPAFVPAVMTKDVSQEPSVALELPGGCVLRFSGSHATEQLADLVVALQSRCQR